MPVAGTASSGMLASSTLFVPDLARGVVSTSIPLRMFVSEADIDIDSGVGDMLAGLPGILPM